MGRIHGNARCCVVLRDTAWISVMLRDVACFHVVEDERRWKDLYGKDTLDLGGWCRYCMMCLCGERPRSVAVNPHLCPGRLFGP